MTDQFSEFDPREGWCISPTFESVPGRPFFIFDASKEECPVRIHWLDEVTEDDDFSDELAGVLRLRLYDWTGSIATKIRQPVRCWDYFTIVEVHPQPMASQNPNLQLVH